MHCQNVECHLGNIFLFVHGGPKFSKLRLGTIKRTLNIVLIYDLKKTGGLGQEGTQK